MNKIIRLSTLWLLLSVVSGVSADEPDLNPEPPGTQMLRKGNVLIPESSQGRAADYGRRAHTSHVILAPDAVGTRPSAAGSSLPWGENPTSLRAVYNLPSTGGAGVIAIVDAYDDPHAAQDLTVFSEMFGLPPCTATSGCFRKVYAKGIAPAVNCGWAQEISLDIEWAHAMAPNARIVLVEAASNNSTDLMQAVNVASSIVSPSGTGFGEVSMSWGMQEFPSEVSYDSYFQQRGVVYVASSGDVGGQRQYPAVSHQVVAAGGTTIHRSPSGAFTGETAWSGSGGGPSAYEARPHYQDSLVTKVGSRRGTPDISFDADPNSGVAVYDSTPCQGVSGWLVFGGTSVSAPALAGVFNLAGHFYASSNIEQSTLYSNLGTPSLRDITAGTAGAFSAGPGWDFVTGVGSVKSVADK
jgi:subtilase family serine protease